MSARSILFSAEMIRALLAGTKTQTRRICKPQPRSVGDQFSTRQHGTLMIRGIDDDAWNPVPCPYGSVGDLLWVRETWRRLGDMADPECTGPKHARFAATVSEAEWATSKWKPSIFMPRWASRITLRITDVRVQRLQEISEADARAEGIAFTLTRDPFASGSAACRWASAIHSTRAWNSACAAYEELWESINGKGSWAKNEWVWALTFEVIKANVDDVMRSKAA